MQTVKQWLESKGRKFPEPDGDDGSTSMAAYEAARLPMVVACTACTMTMALTPERACNADGEIFCADCAEPDPSCMRDHAVGCAGRLSDSPCNCGADDEAAEPTPDRSPWVICTLCHGDGHHVNPSIDAGGLSADDLNDDPDFAEGYMRGDYDVTCARCGGSGKIREAELEAIYARESERAESRRLAAREDGDAEGYYSASDPRWG